MKPKYIERDGYVSVLTPHFREQFISRENLLPSNIFDFEYEVGIMDRVWSITTEDITFGFRLGAGFVYGKKKYNKVRQRWELEFISFTPANKFHTEKLKYAQFLEI